MEAYDVEGRDFNVIRQVMGESLGRPAQAAEISLVQARGNDERWRRVYRVQLAPSQHNIQTFYAKLGNDFQIRKEHVLYREVFAPDLTSTPRLVGSCTCDDVICLLLESVSGTAFDMGSKSQVEAVFRRYAHFHNQGRSFVTRFTHLVPSAGATTDPTHMFDRLTQATGLGEFDLTADALEPFYDSRWIDLVMDEPLTLVHGDISGDNILLSSDSLDVHFIDFGLAAVRPGSSEFLYYNLELDNAHFPSHRLEFGLRSYWSEAETNVSFREFLMRQAYWSASYSADCLSEWGELGEESRKTLRPNFRWNAEVLRRTSSRAQRFFG